MDTRKNISKFKKVLKIILPLFLIFSLLVACPVMTACGKKDNTTSEAPYVPKPPKEYDH